MKCLWLTRRYPRPTNSGELIYSNGLIRSFAQTGVALTVIAHDNEESPVGDGSSSGQWVDADGVTWLLGAPELGSRLPSLLSRLPSDSYRLKEGGPEALFKTAIKENTWDVVIIDHAALGWALKHLDGARSPEGDEPAVVYVSHNYEGKIRKEIARQSTQGKLHRWLLKWDAAKYSRLEGELLEKVDLVTAITATEAAEYKKDYPLQRYLPLTPGYEGTAHHDRAITHATPRRLVMSGSFEWIAKRMNLMSFLEQAAEPLEKAGIELQIVGKTEEGFRSEMQARYPKVDFVGRVPEISPYLLDARIGLIVEEVGGGFKLKALDYIFHGLPLVGLKGAVEGLPLKSPRHLLLAKNFDQLVKAVTELIDDMDRLNQMRSDSLAICERAFRWDERGKTLHEHLQVLSGTAQIYGPGLVAMGSNESMCEQSS